MKEQQILSQHQLNRALLARQFLLTRATRSVFDTVEHLLGMQSQAPLPPYTGLWSRLDAFDPFELSRLLEDREVVRILLMRGTVHLVTARDCQFLRPLIQPLFDRAVGREASFKNQVGDAEVHLEALLAFARGRLHENPATGNALGQALAEQWPLVQRDNLPRILQYALPLVQIPPRGLWGQSGLPVLALAEQWLDGPLDVNPSRERLVLRYLTAFGPASVKDMQAWSGLTRLRDAFEVLRSRLLTFRDERGVELFDLPESPRPEPDIPAPIRFIPAWDNLLLAHADRRRIITDEYRKQVWTINGIVGPALLVDGFVRGMWSIQATGGMATLAIRLFEPISDSARMEIMDEGERLLAFSAADARQWQVTFE